MRVQDLILPSEWKEACARGVETGGPILIVGGVDTGKSSIAQVMLAELIRAHGTAALLDGDVGMNMVGPPGLVGLTLVVDADKLDERPAADRTWFVGSTTPQGHVVQMVLGHLRLATLAREGNMPLVVNSGGYVDGLEAKELHLALADAIQPSLVIGLQIGTECEHLLTPLERRGLETIRLTPSPRTKPKPKAYRTQIRSERFARYFEEGETQTIPIDHFSIEGSMLGSGQTLDDDTRKEIEAGLDSYLVDAEQAGSGAALVFSSEPHDERASVVARDHKMSAFHVIQESETGGLLVGFLEASGECLGLGLIENWTGNREIVIYTPLDLATLSRAKRLALGTVRLGRNGEENGMWSGERTIGLVETTDTTDD